VPLIRYTIEPKTEEKPELKRKWLIATIIIAIIVVGGLGWYYFFGTSSKPPTPAPVLYVDGRLYNSTSITWNLNAAPGATFYSLHNASNPTLGNASANAFFNYTASFYNGSQWRQIYNGTNWLISNRNVTVTMVLTSGTLSTLTLSAFSRNVSELSTYFVFISYTDQALIIKFQYPGNQPAVDGQTVFTYLGFDGNANGILNSTSDRAFNFTNNPSRANVNMLQVYTPVNTTAWNTTATNTYSWNGATLPSDAPPGLSVAITPDRKNVTWTIPYGAIGASKDSYIGVVIQAFGYDFFPTGATQTTPPTPDKYYRLSCLLPSVPTFEFTVQPAATVTFYLKVTFSANAIAGTKYTFNFTATSPS
jgi:hypothetical protein